MADFRVLESYEWRTLRDTRLRALDDSPETFLATYSRELDFDQAEWRAEFERGEWIIGPPEGPATSLVGIVSAPDILRDERYIEYMWVAPRHRRSGVATRMLEFVVERMRDCNVRRIYLYVLDGNDPAISLYKQMDFVSTGNIHTLEQKPGRSEELMVRDLL